MSTETSSTSSSARNSGIALILIGLLILAAQLFDLPSMGQLFLPALGMVFLVWGLLSRSGGLLIPGGVLTGIGVGVYLMDVLPLTDTAQPGVFMLSFGGGFALISLLSALFTPDKHWWALIPGAIMALIGGALLIGGTALTVLEIVGTYWPVVLIVLGAYILLKRR
jgi:hypothetical protein